ncbi:MAG: hypothetical protein Q8M16_03220 [Pirellulaceae bacterium]|nr:hypothetical protein [Pirellulaceae bacterium]
MNTKTGGSKVSEATDSATLVKQIFERESQLRAVPTDLLDPAQKTKLKRFLGLDSGF